MNFGSGHGCHYQEGSVSGLPGVDLNRNYPVDYGTEQGNNDPCAQNFAGSGPLSERETQAYSDFVSSHQSDLKFIINFHSYGNQFIWPMNGKSPNDLEQKAPGLLAIFRSISQKAPFPSGYGFGNSDEVLHQQIGGDADDYVTTKFGIPAVTAELGTESDYGSDHFSCNSNLQAFHVTNSNQYWVNYIFKTLPEIS